MTTSFNLGGARVTAWSRAGVGTAIHCAWSKKVRVAFDMGTRLPAADGARHVFLSHCHLDHIAHIFIHARTRAMLGAKEPTRYYCPAPCAPLLEQARVAFEALDAQSGGLVADAEEQEEEEEGGSGADPCGHGPRLAMEIVPLTAGDTVDVGDGVIVRAFRTAHRVPSLGYGVVRTVRSGLLPRFAALCEVPDATDADADAMAGKKKKKKKKKKNGGNVALRDALRAAKAAGEETNIVLSEVSCVYTGDTTFDALLRTEVEWIWSARLLICECTFCHVDAASAKSAGASWVSEAKAATLGHVHLAPLKRAYDSGRFDELGALFFVHFSGRYRAKEIAAAVRGALTPRRAGEAEAAGAGTEEADAGAGADAAADEVRPPPLIQRTALALAAWGVPDGEASLAMLRGDGGGDDGG